MTAPFDPIAYVEAHRLAMQAECRRVRFNLPPEAASADRSSMLRFTRGLPPEKRAELRALQKHKSFPRSEALAILGLAP